MKKMATAMLLMVAVVKLVGGLSAEEMANCFMRYDGNYGTTVTRC